MHLFLKKGGLCKEGTPSPGNNSMDHVHGMDQIRENRDVGRGVRFSISFQ